jgi:tRNA threonylcarbamoyladenosine biosynthesis protein TsaE
MHQLDRHESRRAGNGCRPARPKAPLPRRGTVRQRGREDIGAGKTVLAKGIAAAMDVDGPVTSPTFVQARVHPPRRRGTPAMIHVEVYRLLDHNAADLLGELDSLDLDTDLDDAVVVVEWGEGLAERLAERHLDIRLVRISDSDTRIATWQWDR